MWTTTLLLTALTITANRPPDRAATLPPWAGGQPLLFSVAAEAPAVVVSAVTRDALAAVTVNGEPANAPVELRPGLNVVAIEATAQADGATVEPEVAVGDRRFGPASGWQRATGHPEEDWRTSFSAEGWPTVSEVPPLAAKERLFLRKALWLAPNPEPFFPHRDVGYLPRGTPSLVQPYLRLPEGVPIEDPQLVVLAPPGISFVATDPGIGVGATLASSRPTAGGSEHRLALAADWGRGFELSLRWSDAGGRTLAYQPAIRAGGTFDWRHFSAELVAPSGALSVTPLIIKWQDQGITGTFWVDNVQLTDLETGARLLDCGTFDEPGWGAAFDSTVGEGVGGSRCVKIVATAEQVARQQARWVRLDGADPPPVTAGRRYRIELDLKCQDVVSANTPLKVAALWSVAADAPLGGHGGAVWLEALGGALTEVPRSARWEVLPPLRDVRPARSRIIPCYYSDTFASDEVRAAYAEAAWRSGITWIYGRTGNAVAERLLPRGLGVLLSLPYEPWSAPSAFRPVLEGRQEIQAIDFAGKPIRHTMCPTWALANQPEWAPLLAAQVAGHLAEGDHRGLNWDVEQPVVDPPTFCFCPRCRAAFAAANGLADPEAITTEQLTGQHRAAWVAFRCAQNAELMGLVAGFARAAKPGIEVSLYSGFATRYTQEHYGVDWALMRPHLDLGIAGYGCLRDQVSRTRTALGDVPFVGGEMYYLSPTSDERPAPDAPQFRNRLLRMYLESGCLGVLIWYLPTMDGGAFYYTSEAAELIAAEETFLAGAARVDERYRVDGLPAGNVFAFAKGEETRLYLLNTSADPVTVTVSTEQGSLAGAELSGFGAEPLAGEDGYRVRLAAYGCAVVRTTKGG